MDFNIDLMFLVVLALTINAFFNCNSAVVAQVVDKNLAEVQDRSNTIISKGCRCPLGKKWNGKKCIKKTGEEVCFALFNPVCGCDGMTYSNNCVANLNGIKKFTQDECNSSNGSKSLPIMIE